MHGAKRWIIAAIEPGALQFFVEVNDWCSIEVVVKKLSTTFLHHASKGNENCDYTLKHLDYSAMVPLHTFNDMKQHGIWPNLRQCKSSLLKPSLICIHFRNQTRKFLSVHLSPQSPRTTTPPAKNVPKYLLRRKKKHIKIMIHLN